MVMMMTTAIATPTALASTPPPRPAIPERRKFTAADLRRMVKAGILPPDDPVALRDGKLFYQHNGAPRRFNVDEYYALAEAGILHPEERVELLAGEIITMAPMLSPHAACIRLFEEMLHESIGRRATKCGQMPLRLNDTYSPEPDYMLLRRRADFYSQGHPTPDDVLLLIEVADSSVRTDRRRKIPSYAQAGIPEVWLADLTQRQVDVYDQPTESGYARMRAVGIDGVLTPTAFPGIIIPVSAILPA